jgi:predicted porin
MSGLAKSATSAVPVQAPVHITTQGVTTTQWDDIPVDIYRFFGEQLGNLEGREKDKVKSVSDWAFQGTETVGDAMIKLRNLEMKLGSPSGNEKRYDRLYNWVKMDRQIQDMRKRQEALRRL